MAEAPDAGAAAPEEAAKPAARTAPKTAAKAPASHAKNGSNGSASPAPARAPASGGRAATKVLAEVKEPAVKRTTFDRDALAVIRKNLLVQREELERQLLAIEEVSFNSSQSEMSGEVSFDEDYADAGSFTFEREKDLSIANNVTDLRSKIDRALHNIEDGSYGLCESCGQPIEGPRLKALPHVTLCLKCKKAEERR